MTIFSECVIEKHGLVACTAFGISQLEREYRNAQKIKQQKPKKEEVEKCKAS